MLKTLCIVALMILSSSPVWAVTNWVATPASIVLTVTPGQTGIKQVVTVTNNDTASVTIGWSDSIDFLKSISPVGPLTVPANGSKAFTVTVDIVTPWNCTGGCPMVVGTYSGNVTLTGGGITQLIPVVLSIGAVVVTKPAKVIGVTVVSRTSAVLEWTPNTESDLAGYKVYIRTGTIGYTTGISISSATYAVTGLLPQTTYFFVVTAVDTAGNESGHSNEVSFITF